jgi:dihydrofolate reductase
MLALIAAVAENNVIGNTQNTQNGLPWHLPDELQYFRKTTKASAVIMGRKTHEAIGRILPNRTNIIITNQSDYVVDGATVVHTLEEAIAFVNTQCAFIIGGRSVYEQAFALPELEKLYITTVHANAEGDVFFPQWNKEDWSIESSDFHPQDERHEHAFTKNVYRKNIYG